MKLYVWEEVLNDWTEGIAFALAGSLEEAKKLIADSYNKNFGWTGDDYKIPSFLNDQEPKVYDTPIGYTIWGGG